MHKKSWIVGLVLLVPAFLFAQSDSSLRPEQRAEVVLRLAEVIERFYVFESPARILADSLRNRLAQGEYKPYDTPQALAERVTRDMEEISGDPHLLLYAGPLSIDVYTSEEVEEMDYYRQDRARNFGFTSSRWLPGNVGYIRLDDFSAWEEAQASATAAVQFVRHTDAIVIDLRENTGGSPEMVQYFGSYFFSKKSRKAFSSLLFREKSRELRMKVLRRLPGRRLPDVPLYILTSPYTASAAEALAYDLKHHDRATIVGDTTRGGANPAQTFALGQGFRAQISIGYAKNPVTGGNWEGIGVIPDYAVPAEQSLEVALKMARTQQN